MHAEDDLLMISALQHLLFCPRQCALIHLEQIWTENLLTAEGRLLHEHVHAADIKSRSTIRIEYDMPLRSFRLGLAGRADVVEMHLMANGTWQPFPVEYKRGKPKKDDADLVQLCAQALCLEEMLGKEVPEGAIYYGQKMRRTPVEFDNRLRQVTENAAARLHELMAGMVTPAPEHGARCASCSLVDACLPSASGKQGLVQKYLAKMIE